MSYKFKNIVFILLFISIQINAQDYETIQVKSSYTGSWTSQRTKLVNLIPDYVNLTDGSDDFNRYGSYKYLRTDSTGFFYTKKIDGRWWLIDPDGYAGINRAVTSFTTSNIQNDYDLVRKLGFNGTGNFLSSESQTKTGYNLQNYPLFSYTRRLNFFLNYKNVRKNYYTTPAAVLGSLDHLTVFDPQFEIYCDNLANTSAAPYANERDLLGYYTDNELNFNQDQLQNLVKDLLAGDPSRDSALVFAASKGLTEADCINYTSNVTEAIKQEFAAVLAEKYFKIVSSAIRKSDSNHLMLGSRLNGRPRSIQAVVNASHRYMDVTSVNFYDRFTPNEQIAKTTWTNDKPCIVGEFYIKDINIFNSSQSGAGWYVNGQSNRGNFYQNTGIELLQNKCYIGWQYFKYMDESDSNKGIVNSSGIEYTGMTSFMNELNKQVYHLCDYYDGKARRPEFNTDKNIFNALEDTYIIPGTTNVSNFGSETELEIRYNSTEANRRETFLKFDLTSVKDSIPNLKHAQLEVNFTQTDATSRSLFVSGLTDNSWEENVLTGSLRNANSDWKNGYNRLDFEKGVISEGNVSFDVTTWINEQVRDGIVSFKLHDLVSTNTSVKIASRENSDESKRPKLTLTFYDKNSTGLQTVNNNTNNRIFPNPASGSITVRGIDVVETEIFNLNGQQILRSQLNTIDISSCAKGVYLVKLITNTGKIEQNKLIIN